jgi:hypothetical protein
MALVRYRTNDCSVPVEWGHREVLVKGFVHEVVICAASEVIERHPRARTRRHGLQSAALLALLSGRLTPGPAAPLAG